MEMRLNEVLRRRRQQQHHHYGSTHRFLSGAVNKTRLHLMFVPSDDDECGKRASFRFGFDDR
jgi:hypothetical protein